MCFSSEMRHDNGNANGEDGDDDSDQIPMFGQEDRNLYSFQRCSTFSELPSEWDFF